LLHNGAPITSRNKNQHKPYMLTDNAETLRMLTAASAATSTLQKSNVQRSSEVYNHKNTTRSSNRAQIRTIRNTLKQYPDLEDMILSRIIHSSPDAYTIFHDLGFSDAKYMRCAVHGNSTHAIKHFANSATNKHILTPWVLHTIRDSNHVALRNLVHTLQGNTICKTCVIPAIYHNDTEAVAIMAHYISYTSSVSNTNVSREGLLSILKHDYRYNYAKRNNKRLCGRILYRHLRDNILAHTSAISDRKPDGTIPEYDTLNGHLRRLPRDIYFYIQDFLPLSTLLMHNSDI